MLSKPQGRIPQRTRTQNRFRKLLQKVEVTMRCHGLRHFAVSLWIEQGFAINEIMTFDLPRNFSTICDESPAYGEGGRRRRPILGRRVARELTTLIERRGKSGVLLSDNGAERTLNAIMKWCAEHKVEWP